MWQQVAHTLRALVTLSEQLRENKEEIKALRQELQQLTTAVYQLRVDIDRIQERESSERIHLAKDLEQRHELLKRQIENILLRFERRLPGQKDEHL